MIGETASGQKLKFDYTNSKELLMTQKEPVRMSTVGAGIAIGAGVGAALGVAMGNIAVGVGVGIAIGAAIGASMQKKGR